MAMISTPEQAVQQLSELFRKSDNPRDKGFIVALGRAIMDTVDHLEMVHKQDGTAQKGCITVKIPMHTFKDGMGEVKTKIAHNIERKLPSEYASYKGELYVQDGVLSTSPFAKEQKKMFPVEVIEGGNAVKPVEPKAGSKAL